MTEEPTGSHRTYWHSDHYRGQIGNSLEGPIWDVLKDHPAGVTVPQIRDALVNDRRIRAAQSWFISFGAEQRHRAGKGKFENRYRRMDPESLDSDVWTWDEERRYHYALTERIHWFIRSMVTNGEAVVVGTSDDLLSKSEVLQQIVIANRTKNRLPTYTAGKVPQVTDINPRCQCGRSHHTTYKRPWVHHEGLGPDPYVLRDNWRDDVNAALASGRMGNARALLTRGLELLD